MAGYTPAQIAAMQAKLPSAFDNVPDANGVNQIYAGILPPSSPPSSPDIWNSTGIPASQVNSMGSGLSSYVDQNGQRVMLPPNAAASAAASVASAPMPASFPNGPPIDYSDPMWGGSGPPNDYSDPIWGRTGAPPAAIAPSIVPTAVRPPVPAVRSSQPSAPSAPAPTMVRLASGTMAPVGSISTNAANGYSYRVNADGTTTNISTGHTYGAPTPTFNLAADNRGGDPSDTHGGDPGGNSAYNPLANSAAGNLAHGYIQQGGQWILDPVQQAQKVATANATMGANFTSLGYRQMPSGQWVKPNGQFANGGNPTAMYNPAAASTPPSGTPSAAASPPVLSPPRFNGPPGPGGSPGSGFDQMREKLAQWQAAHVRGHVPGSGGGPSAFPAPGLLGQLRGQPGPGPGNGARSLMDMLRGIRQ